MKMNRKIWIALGLFLVVIAGYGFYWRQQKKLATPKFKEVLVQRGDLNLTILSTGVVQPENRLEIKAPIAGRVEKVLVNEGDHVKKGQLLASMSSTERAALLDAATTKGPEELKRWEALYKPTAILAPIDGMIIQRNVESGQTFTVSDAIFVMSDRLTVKAQVDETDISQIQLKQKATLALDAYPENTIAASVDQIAFDAKTVNNVTNYVVDVLPNQPPDFMRSGMTANVTFQVASKMNVLLIPSEATKVKDGINFVSVPNPDGSGKPVEKEIKAGASDGKRLEVVSGLSEGEKILVPEFRLEGKKGGSSPFSPSRPRGR